ncbi:MAG: 2-hydroxyacid dehydrogenase [Gammaproteobacteria bacterium]|nr:2-hydroxyacid dehydrogenase [Gammaproteobacteria bacterium]
MKRLKGVFLDLASVDRGDLNLSALTSLNIDWSLHRTTQAADTAERIRDAQVIISNKVVLDRALLEGAASLRLVCIAATGTNNIELEAAQELGIAVTNVTRYATPSVVQHVFSLMLALATHLPDYQRLTAAHRWERSEQFCLMDYPIQELEGKTLGIVGYGELGRAAARVAKAFGMHVLISQRPGGPQKTGRVPFDKILGQVDVLSLHCPLTDDTHKLIGKRELSLMKPDALLVNTARGGIVDESALASALRNGVIGGAGIDVLSAEPPKDGNPLLDHDLPNLIVTPHIAWASRESRQRLIEEIARNIRAFIKDKTRNRLS